VKRRRVISAGRSVPIMIWLRSLRGHLGRSPSHVLAHGRIAAMGYDIV